MIANQIINQIQTSQALAAFDVLTCTTHNAKVKKVCINKECLSNGTYALCQMCKHPNDHEIFRSNDVFSIELLNNIEDLIKIEEQALHQSLQPRKDISKKVDDFYDNLYKKVQTILLKSKERVMQKITGQYQASQDTFKLKQKFNNLTQDLISRRATSVQYLETYGQLNNEYLSIQNTITEIMSQEKENFDYEKLFVETTKLTENYEKMINEANYKYLI